MVNIHGRAVDETPMVDAMLQAMGLTRATAGVQAIEELTKSVVRSLEETPLGLVDQMEEQPTNELATGFIQRMQAGARSLADLVKGAKPEPPIPAAGEDEEDDEEEDDDEEYEEDDDEEGDDEEEDDPAAGDDEEDGEPDQPTDEKLKRDIDRVINNIESGKPGGDEGEDEEDAKKSLAGHDDGRTLEQALLEGDDVEIVGVEDLAKSFAQQVEEYFGPRLKAIEDEIAALKGDSGETLVKSARTPAPVASPHTVLRHPQDGGEGDAEELTKSVVTRVTQQAIADGKLEAGEAGAIQKAFGTEAWSAFSERYNSIAEMLASQS